MRSLENRSRAFSGIPRIGFALAISVLPLPTGCDLRETVFQVLLFHEFECFLHRFLLLPAALTQAVDKVLQALALFGGKRVHPLGESFLHDVEITRRAE